MLFFKRAVVVLNSIFIAVCFILSSLSIKAADNLRPQNYIADSSNVLSAAADSMHWDLQGKTGFTEYHGRKSIFLNGGAAILKDFEMRDAIIDVDLSTPASRGFFGVQFRIDSTGANAEYLYLRQHYSGQPDAMQYTPVIGGGLNWQIYNGPGFTGAVDIPHNEWFHLRIVIKGAQAYLYVKDMNNPALVMNDLKSGVDRGSVALVVLLGEAYFSDFKIQTTPDADWVREEPPMMPGILTGWELSPSYDALSVDPERPLTGAETDTIQWQSVEAEAPGFVTIYRYRSAPRIRVTFANDFSKRLEPQPGSKLIYAKCIINSTSDGVKKLSFGYSDEVSIFLNGNILFRGRSAQNFRDTRFLGIVDPENDAVYLPLKKGRNELILALSELGGGWGFICRLDE
ncbi:MAG: hypothetical protein HOP31_14365 [Ignavibacteria bacterium]|nr:hypothetical protein [Ignavibacteria bacterium]